MRQDKKRWKDIAVVLCILFIFPYMIQLFSNKEVDVINSNMDYSNLKLIGAVAKSMPITFEDDTIKCQLIVMRTRQAYSLLQESEEDKMEVMTLHQMKDFWGAEFDANFNRIAALAKETEGMVITYEEEPIYAPYFYLSGGYSRAGLDALGQEYPYLIAVDCRYDMEALEYEKTVTYTNKQLLELFNKSNPEWALEEPIKITVISRDNSDYVVKVKIGEHEITGEQFRQILSLNSSDFTIEQNNNEIMVCTKGIGHGVGFDQYGANIMAKKGENYFTILSYFYPNTKIKK